MQFGGLIAVNDLTMFVDYQEIVALIGPNGAGKTTAFNMITGVYKPTSGHIALNKENVTGTRPDRIAQRGMARTFQNIRLFKALSVLDNVVIAQHLRLKSSWLASTLRLPRYNAENRLMYERAEEVLTYMGLWDARGEISSSLPYGAQRKLEIARALATQPVMLLLDEPAAGMNPAESQELTGLIQGIRDHFKLTILLIEHHMDVVMDISDRIYVLDYGNLIAVGTPAEIQANDAVVQAYLGVEENEA
ncbi:MAG: ABC transporter ATP-binding protein [Oscillospiraceae bacterium]|nr:ABC transporter ATP-binding protein [Oscillospiraceae bacterium]